MRKILDTLEQALRTGQSVAYTALVETRGSTPQKAGAAMLAFADGTQAGTLGGGCVEAEVKRRALFALNDGGDPAVFSFDLDNDYGWDDGLICGGRMTVLVHPFKAADPAAGTSPRRSPGWQPMSILTCGFSTTATALPTATASRRPAGCSSATSARRSAKSCRR